MDAFGLIAKAMVAWSEVWMGYPDHALKVYGNLIKASELLRNEEIAMEARKFRAAFNEGMKYRPPFENMAWTIANGNKQVIPHNQIPDSQLCYDCAGKHLSSASVAWDQIKNGQPASWIDLIGNLAHAEEHLIEKHEELAGEIRKDRKTAWAAMLEGTGIPRPEFEMHLLEVSNLARAMQ